MGGIIYLEPKEFVTEEILVNSFNEETDPLTLALFADEQNRAGLSGVEITLLRAKHPPVNFAARFIMAETQGSKEQGYTISLYPQIIGEGWLAKKHTIRHELAHIFYGDCDRLENRKKISWYRTLFQELRAEWYAYKS